MAEPAPDGPPAPSGGAAPYTVALALAEARADGLDRVDAHTLLAHLLGRSRAWLIAHDDAALEPSQAGHWRQCCQRRAAGEPVAYLTAQQEFYGLMLALTPAVLIPRADTETLVDWALALLPTLGDSPAVLDLGTGSGAIALAVARHWPSTRVCASDASAAALAVAQANAQQLGLDLTWAQGDWWQAIAPSARYALLLSNPPYIAGDDPHLHALVHEPRGALTPEGDGLGALRTLVAGAAAHIEPGGWILLEHGWDQAEAVQALLRQAGWTEVQTRRDLGGQARCTGGRWPERGAASPRR